MTENRKNNLRVHFSSNSHHMIFSSCLIFEPSFIWIRARLLDEFGRKSQLVTFSPTWKTSMSSLTTQSDSALQESSVCFPRAPPSTSSLLVSLPSPMFVFNTSVWHSSLKVYETSPSWFSLSPFKLVSLNLLMMKVSYLHSSRMTVFVAWAWVQHFGVCQLPFILLHSRLPILPM